MAHTHLLTALVVLAALNLYEKSFASEIGQTRRPIARSTLPKAAPQPKFCTNVDLRNAQLGDVRDQDSIGWCYAFATADLVSYRLRRKISASDLAVNYNNSWFINRLFKKVGWGDHDFQGSGKNGVSESLKATQLKGGACLESNFRSEDNGYSNLMTDLTKLDQAAFRSGLMQTNQCAGAFKSLFPNLRTAELIDAVRESGKAELVASLSDRACKPRIPISKLTVETVSRSFWKGDISEVSNTIDQQLDRHNILTLAYNSLSLHDYTKAKGPANHVSLIVGRRFNPSDRKCEYLIRNSWGRGCLAYDSSYSCEEGNIWVPKSVMMEAAENVSYIK